MTESLWQEYKILQDKIDRIADFRFRIKGWMVTIVIAISFGGYATGRLPYQAYPSLLLVVFMFYAFEQSQKAWHGAFVSRLLTIEKEIVLVEAEQRRLKNPADIVRRTIAPRIGAAIARQKSALRRGFFGPVSYFMTANPHQIFYFFTFLIVFSMGYLSYAYPQKSSLDGLNEENAVQQQSPCLQQLNQEKSNSISKREARQTVPESDNTPPIQKGKSEEGVVQNGSK